MKVEQCHIVKYNSPSGSISILERYHVSCSFVATVDDEHSTVQFTETVSGSLAGTNVTVYDSLILDYAP